MLINVLKSSNDACPYGFLWRQKMKEWIKFDEIISHFWSLPFDLKVWFFGWTIYNGFSITYAANKNCAAFKYRSHWTTFALSMWAYDGNITYVTMVTIQIATMCSLNGWNCDCLLLSLILLLIFCLWYTHNTHDSMLKCLSSVYSIPLNSNEARKKSQSFFN